MSLEWVCSPFHTLHHVRYLNIISIVNTRETLAHYPISFLATHFARSLDQNLWCRRAGRT